MQRVGSKSNATNEVWSCEGEEWSIALAAGRAIVAGKSRKSPAGQDARGLLLLD